VKRTTVLIMTIVFFAVCGQAAADAPDADIWTASAEGNVQAISRHLAAGTDVNAVEPSTGGTPLMVAALFDHREAVELLIENGADLNAFNYEGSTALHTAAFFCHVETVKLLVEQGADVNARNSQGQTALDIVTIEWSDGLSGIYSYYAGLLEVQLDIDRVKATRPEIAAILRQDGGNAAP
jgi:hypothetical protein